MKIENAVIMAAGKSTRFAPLSYEKPKGLWEVRGEILIERQIRQLQKAGIEDIAIVVGYEKEQFYYLKEKFGVVIIENDDYDKYNNTSTLMRVLDRISATYLCSSDNYFLENVFKEEVTEPYYAAVFQRGKTDEWCLSVDENGRIMDVTVGGTDAWCMMGHVCFLPDFSGKFKEILVKEYEREQTRGELWESVYMRHVQELDLYIKRYGKGEIVEFDSLEDLRAFDVSYCNRSNCKIMERIAKRLACAEGEITGIVPLVSSDAEKSFRFVCNGKGYIYRYSGAENLTEVGEV